MKKRKRDLLALLEEKYKGAMVRCREANIAKEEQPSKVFASLERRRATANAIEEINDRSFA